MEIRPFGRMMPNFVFKVNSSQEAEAAAEMAAGDLADALSGLFGVKYEVHKTYFRSYKVREHDVDSCSTDYLISSNEVNPLDYFRLSGEVTHSSLAPTKVAVECPFFTKQGLEEMLKRRGIRFSQ